MALDPVPASSAAATSSELPKTYIETPLIHSAPLSNIVGCTVLLKLELLQPSGSFKSRGVGSVVRHALLNSPPGSDLHFFSSSGGNAGAAAAEACKRFGYPCTVAVPESASPRMIQRLREEYSATVVLHGSVWREADAKLHELMKAYEGEGGKAVYCHPYDNPVIVEGNGTIVPEIIDQAAQLGYTSDKIKAISCSVGGGGLFSGVTTGLQASYPGEHKPTVVAVETVGANKLYQSLGAGKKVTLSAISTVASSLGANEVSDKAWEMATSYPTVAVEITDADAVSACLKTLDNHRLFVEPACGAAIAPWYEFEKYEISEKIKLEKDDVVVLIVCGGSTMTLDALVKYQQVFSL
ncbi:putative serine family amino acid catabolism-related protein [Myxozyma melibiosi]|uniref:L-serine ammonia-lyase n=1 Tax=Myxozyma melibiosi TaxID=54550 RepID=A0ABR1FBE0_9ASCO